MTKPLLVIIPCSRTENAGSLSILRGQLEKENVPYHIAIQPVGPPLGWGMAKKLELYRDWAARFTDYENLVISDAFDVLFYGTIDEVVSKIPTDNVLLAAERNCYPDPTIASRCTGDTPWRYVNGGLTAGTPARILEWMDALESCPYYHPQALDQQVLNMLRADNSPLTPIDSHTELFYCAFIDEGELGAENGMPLNKLCGTHPNFIHFNGGADNAGWFAAREASLQ